MLNASFPLSHKSFTFSALFHNLSIHFVNLGLSFHFLNTFLVTFSIEQCLTFLPFLLSLEFKTEQLIYETFDLIRYVSILVSVYSYSNSFLIYPIGK